MAKTQRAQNGQLKWTRIAAIAGWVAAVAGFWNAYTNHLNYVAQQKTSQALSERVRAIEVERDAAKEAAAKAQADAAKSAKDIKRSLDRFVVFYRKAIDNANQALTKLNEVEAQQGSLKNSDYQPKYKIAFEDWKDSLGALVAVVENGRQVLTTFENLLDHDVDSIRNGLEPMNEKSLREVFVKLRDSVDSKVEALDQSLNKLAQIK